MEKECWLFANSEYRPHIVRSQIFLAVHRQLNRWPCHWSLTDHWVSHFWCLTLKRDPRDLPTWPTYLTYLSDLPTWPTYLTNLPDLPTWPTYLTYLPDLSTWPTYLTYLPDLPTWPTYLTYLPDLPTWPTYLIYLPDLPTWPIYLTYLSVIHTWPIYMTYLPTYLPTYLTYLPCDIWDTDYNYNNWELEFMTIFVTRQLRVTVDSIRNSCDV